jgi:hypothetical protein
MRQAAQAAARPAAVAAFAAVTALAATLPLPAQARITEITLQSVRSFAAGHAFGETGAYERVTGTAKGELDPTDARNKVIVNLDKARKNARGMVEYEMDFDMLRPAEAGKGNRKILFDVTNRGRKFLPLWLMDAPAAGANNPLTLDDAGNGLFLRQGYTIVSTGWDGDAPRTGNGMAMRVPVALNADGTPIVRMIRDELVSATRGPVLREFKLAYESANIDQAQATLTVRRREADPRVEVPNAEWRYKDTRTIEILTPGNAGAGPAVGSLYEMHYPARNPGVLGIGYAATRDFVSYLRYDSSALSHTPGSPMQSAIAVGISQSGRYLRDHISQGFNQDERGRKVFDGVLSHIAGVGRVFLNYEFGMAGRTNTQHEDHLYPENEFPFATANTSDNITGKRGSLLRGDGFDPLVIETNTATEYWQKGASLLTTDPQGQRDVVPPPGARVYLMASTQHGGRANLKADYGPCMNERNPHNPAPALRALTVALDVWISQGVAPPPSRVPTLRDGTLVAPDNRNFPAIPDFAVARQVNEVVLFGDWVRPKLDLAKRYPALVIKTDADGNDAAGIRLPDIAVPLATYTGWNLYKRPFTEGDLCDRDGSYREFAATRAEREKNGDPRLSIEERYASHATYVAKVKAVVMELMRDRLLLVEDGDAYIKRAESDATKKRFAR